MRQTHSYLTCRTNLLFIFFTLFNAVTSSLHRDRIRPNGTKYEAFFQNEVLQVQNRVKSHSIRSSGSPKEIGHLVNELLEGYDRRAWPTYGTNQPTLVSVNMYINSLGSVSAANMDFGMDIYLRQSWVDPRLQLSKFGLNKTVTLQGQDVIDKIWKPDIFFRNLKSGNFHTMTVSNKLIKLSPDGRILFSMRLTLRLSCHMSFRNYPLDAQRCWIILGSYAMTADQVQIEWNKDMPITLEKEIQVPEFQVILQDPGEFYRDIDTGVFSFLNVSFVLLRQNEYHLVQTYLPTFLIVMISWVSFWIPTDPAPARTLIGVTSSLTLATIAGGIRSQLPPISYAKAIDIWIGACAVMCFAAFLEFAAASYLKRMKVRHNQPRTRWLSFWKTPERPAPQSNGKDQVVHTPESDQKIQLRRSYAIDRYSRIIFPFVFLIFNIAYWKYFLSQRAAIEMRLL